MSNIFDEAKKGTEEMSFDIVRETAERPELLAWAQDMKSRLKENKQDTEPTPEPENNG